MTATSNARPVLSRLTRISDPGRLRCRGDEGTALVEAALIAPLFFYVIFGIFEGALYFRDYLTVGNMSATGVRSLALGGKNWYADYDAVVAMQSASTAMPSSNITRIVVYNAGTDGRTPITGPCRSGTPTNGVCNVYTPTNFTLPKAQWDCTSPIYKDTTPSRFWCPAANPPYDADNSGRHTAQTSGGATSGTGNLADYIGLYIEVNHKWLTGLYGTAVTITDTNLARMEPLTVT